MTTLWRRTLAVGPCRDACRNRRSAASAWNRSGDAILFFAGGHLRQFAVNDGKVTDIAEAAAPAGATALVDGSILFAPISSGNIRRLQSGQATDATTSAG